MKTIFGKIFALLSLAALFTSQGCKPAYAWTVGMSLTNFDGTLATNSFRIYRAQDNPMVDGTRLVLGSPVTVPTTNGAAAKIVLPGTYELRIVGYTLPRPIYFVAPEGTGSNDVTELRISGVNFFKYTPTGGGTVQTNISYAAVTNLNEFSISNIAPNFQISDVQVRATNGWVDMRDFNNGVKAVAFAGNFVGNAASATNLNADELRSGTVADARIASTIARDSEVTAADTVVSNGVVSGLAAGSYAVSGNGAGLTNVPASSIVKYISQTKPVNADSNWFGPWTPGTVTAGIQEAWDSVVKPTNAGPTAKGVVFQFEGGYYYFTNALVFSNYWPMALTFRGANLLDTKLVYAGDEVGTNTITFKGAGTPRGGSLNLPVHLTVTDLGFTAIKDTTNILVKVGNYSHANFTRCNFTSWLLMTNQVDGAGVSLDSSSTVGITSGNLVGLYITDGPEHSTILDDIFFAGLATGLDARNDHTTAFSLKFAHIGVFSSAWPATSRYSLGACIVKEGGLDSVWYYCHFYSAKSAFVLLGNAYDSPLLDHANIEQVNNPFGALPNGRTPILRDPVEYGDTPEWQYVTCITVSNSPNYGFVAGSFVTNFVAYGIDGSAAASGSPFAVWRVRYGVKDMFAVDSLGTKTKGRGEYASDLNVITSDPDNGWTISDASFNQYVQFNPTGTGEATVSFSSPKFIVGTPTITSGTGAPSADEPKGSLYLRTDGSTSTTLYVKTATGGGGWTAK